MLKRDKLGIQLTLRHKKRFTSNIISIQFIIYQSPTIFAYLCQFQLFNFHVYLTLMTVITLLSEAVELQTFLPQLGLYNLKVVSVQFYLFYSITIVVYFNYSDVQNIFF